MSVLNLLSSAPFPPHVAHNSGEFKLMLFDLEASGHHGGYIQHLVRYWCQQQLPGQLDIVVSPKFIIQHNDVVNLATQYPQSKVNFITIPDSQAAKLDSVNSFTGRIVRAFQEWRLLNKYIKLLQPDHCLLMFLDSLLLRFARGASLPCSFSTIYFRPIFHYPQFEQYQASYREKLWHRRDRLCLSSLLKSPQLHTLFSLDPFAVEPLKQFNPQARVMYLPDPVEIYDDVPYQTAQLSADLGIEPGRRVFLLFGALAERKGMYQLLEALRWLPCHLQQQICILLIGPVRAAEKDRLEAQVSQINHSLPVQIICRHQFVADQDIQPYFHLADVILAPYQRHVGMSAILVRAAAAQKPVLSTNYGLMGEVTRHHELGLTVDATKPREIARGLKQFLQHPGSSFCNALKMQQFAQVNNAKAFAQTIFTALITHGKNNEAEKI